MNETRKASERRGPGKPVSEESLLKSAFYHLQRFATSRANLVRVLERRVMKARRQGRKVPEAPDKAIDAVMARIDELGLLDDRAFGEALVRRLRAGGASRRLLAAKLYEKGLPKDMIPDLLGEGDAEEELAAARAYAKRRRLGPFRPKDRAAFRDKDLAALARRGFSYDVARQVIEAPATRRDD